MTFEIKLDRRGRVIDRNGEIVIDDFRAAYLVDLSFWELEDYRASWARAAAAVLEHGFGRFLVSIGAPGVLFDTWPCWRRGDEALLLHSILLPTISGEFTRVEDAEVYGPESPEIDPGQLTLHRCSLADIANFERRLAGASAQ